jgi:hypothetical protein
MLFTVLMFRLLRWRENADGARAGELFPSTDPSFVIVRLAGQEATKHPQRTVAAELHTGELVVSETPALDVLLRYYAAEPSRGCVGLYERGKGLQATIDLRKK